MNASDKNREDYITHLEEENESLREDLRAQDRLREENRALKGQLAALRADRRYEVGSA